MRAAAIQVVVLVSLLVLAVGALAIVFWRASAAEKRARLLLRDLLTEAEYQQIEAHGYLDIMSPGRQDRFYRIPRDGGRVRVYEHGSLKCELCLRSTRSLPVSDSLVLHKVLIEGNEANYLATANRFSVVNDRYATTPLYWYW